MIRSNSRRSLDASLRRTQRDQCHSDHAHYRRSSKKSCALLRNFKSRIDIVRACTKLPVAPCLALLCGDKVGLMADTINAQRFEEIVEWAYGTLPQKVRDLPDFPGIQVIDEPPADILKEMSVRKNWRRGTELLGLYSGIFRTKQSYAQLKYAPDLIFVFRGPVLRCSKGDLPGEVKRVVWHEVAHWLGYETEEQVAALGL